MLLPDNLVTINTDNDFIFRRILMASNLFLRIFNCLTPSIVVACLLGAPSAWAYKVEKICEDLPATASAPAQKKCKVVRIQAGGAAKAGDGKAGDAKGGDAKKDAKPAGGH
jgi:hypothetical protein